MYLRNFRTRMKNQTGQSCKTRESDRTLMTLRSLHVIVLCLAITVPLDFVVPAAAQEATESSTAAPVADNQGNMIDAPSATLKSAADKAQQSLLAQSQEGRAGTQNTGGQDTVPQDPSTQNH